jgi:nucleotide-binding universal stress UspA family protein
MDYHDLLVHVDTTSEGRARLTNALHLATRIGARITGVGAAAFEPDVVRTRGIYQEKLRKCVELRIEEAAEIFRDVTAGTPNATWRSHVGRPLDVLASLACGADLIFGSREAESDSSLVFARPDSLVLAAGTPVLLQPPESKPLVADRIVLGWDNTRASRRIIRDSLPLLKLAAAVYVLALRPKAEDEIDELNTIEDRLRRHGVNVRSERTLQAAANSVHDTVIQAAEDLHADLVVIGTNDNGRWLDLLSGDATRKLIAKSPTYVLTSH